MGGSVAGLDGKAVLLSVRSAVLEVLGFGRDLGLAVLVGTSRDVATSVDVLVSRTEVVGVSRVVARVVDALVTKGGRNLRMVVGLAVATVVLVVVATVVVVAAVVVVVVVVVVGESLAVVLVVAAFQLGTTGVSVTLGIYRTLVVCSGVVSSAGNGSKGVTTGCTEVMGSTAAVVGSVMDVSVVRPPAVSSPDSCSKSERGGEKQRVKLLLLWHFPGLTSLKTQENGLVMGSAETKGCKFPRGG